MKSVTLCTTHEIRNSYFKLSLNKTQNCYTDRSLKHSRKKIHTSILTKIIEGKFRSFNILSPWLLANRVKSSIHKETNNSYMNRNIYSLHVG